MVCPFTTIIFFFFNDTATTEIYTLSLHDALPISRVAVREWIALVIIVRLIVRQRVIQLELEVRVEQSLRSEEHTSELQSLAYLVCRLLLEKKKKYTASLRRYLSCKNENCTHLPVI